MIIATHAIVYTKDADADRAFVRDVLKFPSVDAGDGWLIFALPPAELACHPTDGVPAHELYLMCDDIGGTVKSLHDNGINTTPIAEASSGLVITLTTPGGAEVGLYQPRHRTAISTWACLESSTPPHQPRPGRSRKAAGSRARSTKARAGLPTGPFSWAASRTRRARYRARASYKSQNAAVCAERLR